MPIYLPKEKICPILSLSPRQIGEGEEEQKGLVFCEGEKCALFKGKDNSVDGICAISDIAGWMQNLHGLAKLVGEKAEAEEEEKKKKEKEEEEKEEDR